MSKKSKSSFKGKTTGNASKRKKGSGYGYLIIPKKVDIFNAEADTKVEIDIMPYLVKISNHPDKDDNSETAIKGSYWYKRPFKIHRSVGVNNDAIVCPKSIGKRCPICEHQDMLRKKDNADENEIKSLRASDRNLYAIKIKKVDGKKFKNSKVHLFDFSDYLFQEKFEEQLSDKDEFETFPDHKEGSTLDIRFVEETLNKNKYAAPSRFDFITRKKQYSDDVLDEIPNLDNCFTVLSYDELKAKFFEIDTDDGDGKKKKDKKGKDSKRKRKTIPNKKDSKKNKKLECPEGYKFGKEHDKHKKCEKCDVWNECYEKKNSK